MLSSSLYNQLKFVAQILLPALGTLYFTVAGIWGLPAAEQVVGTIVAVDAFLGVILQISSSKYNQVDRVQGGVIKIDELDDKKLFSLELEGDPEALEDKQEVVFKVKKKGITDNDPIT